MKKSVQRGARGRGLVPGLVLGLLMVSSLSGAAIAGQKPKWVAQGAEVNAGFGATVNVEADLNGDGLIDLIVGSPGGTDFKGAIDVFYGTKNGLSKKAGFHYAIDMPWAQVGYSPIAVDINGDGYMDLVVGADNYSGQHPYSGAVMVFLGSAKGFPKKPSQIIEGEATNSFFGFGIRSLGDFNGDGYADVLVSAIGMNDGLGRLYVYKGGPTGLARKPVSILNGQAPQLYFGRSLAVGDANGDGIADIIVGLEAVTGQGVPGMVKVFNGSRDGYATTASQTVFSTGSDPYDWFGDTVAYLGDVDGDGFADLAVGVPRRYRDDSHMGEVTIYYGSATGWSAQGRTQALYAQGMNYFGANILGGKDLNGDGRPDLVAGPSLYDLSNDPNVPFPGTVAVFYGGPKGIAELPAYTLSGDPASRDGLGLTLAAAKLGGDDAMDLILGSSIYSGTMAGQGEAVVYRHPGSHVGPVKPLAGKP